MEDITGSASSVPNTERDTTSDAARIEAADDEFPAELQQLLQRLEGNLEPESEAVHSLLDIEITVKGKHGDISYWSYASPDGPCEVYTKFRLEWESQGKKNLLQATGSCRAIRQVVLDCLSGDELLTVLTPLQLNPVLQELDIYQPQLTEPACAEDDYIQKICVILGRILNTSCTLEGIVLDNCLLSVTGAHQLASGLRGNSGSALRELRIWELEEAGVVKHIAEIVSAASRLEVLWLLKVGVVDDDGIDALANALRQTTTLKQLTLGNITRGASGLLLKAFTGAGSNQSIHSLYLEGSTAGIAKFLPKLLCSSQCLIDLHLSDWKEEDASPKQWRSLSQSMCSSSSLERFRLALNFFDWRNSSIYLVVEELLSGTDLKKPRLELYLNCHVNNCSPWRSGFNESLTVKLPRGIDREKPTVELHLFSFDADRSTDKVWITLANIVSSKLIPLSSLHLQLAPWLRGAPKVENFFDGLGNSSTLRELTIERGDAEHWPIGWKRMFSCLRGNTSIRSLELRDCEDLDDEDFKDLMGVLQVNSTLKTIGLKGCSWERDGKAALIKVALKRNAEQDSSFALLREARLKFDGAKVGRLFLCGFPLAGKTQLRHTMVRIVRRSPWLRYRATQLLRTKGIDYKLLIDDQHMQIAVWDLAEQYNLQDILFPRSHHTSVFLFMFNPYERESGCTRTCLDESFKAELKEWLRFIASNSQVTGHILPKVLVVISHMDKLKDRNISWAESIVGDVRENFKNILDICSSKDVFQVDTRSKMEVTPLTDFILNTFRELLEYKSPIVPAVCSQVSPILAKRTKDIKYRPVWTSQEFHNFCSSHLQHDATRSPKPETQSGLVSFKANASYLHDTGSIVAIPSLDRIIIDPNRLNFGFLGELIAMGQNFQMRSKAVQSISSRTGFVSSSVLLQLLSSFLEQHPKFKELDKSFLVELLIHFDVCYKLDDEEVYARYYIPNIVSEDNRFRVLCAHGVPGTSKEHLSWTSSLEGNHKFMGFGIQHETYIPRMSMTPSLFPCFQVYFRRNLMKEMKFTNDVMCTYNTIRLCMDSHEIILEWSDMTKSHIDVMVKCSKHKSRESAVQFIQKHILDELLSFCASPKGCPGIALVVKILQTKCVEMLIPSDCRGEQQAILVEHLKGRIESSIIDHLQEMKPESRSANAKTVLDCAYSWPPIDDHLPSTSELARDLLSESEVDNVTKRPRQNFKQRLEILDRISLEMSQEISRAEGTSGIAAVSDVGTVETGPVRLQFLFPTFLQEETEMNSCVSDQVCFSETDSSGYLPRTYTPSIRGTEAASSLDLEAGHAEAHRKYHPVEINSYIDEERSLQLSTEVVAEFPTVDRQMLVGTSVPPCSFQALREDMWAPTTTTAAELCCCESRQLLDFNVEKRQVSLRPDVIDLGFTDFDESSFDMEKILCIIYTESDTDDAVELNFFHVKGMAAIFGVGLPFSIVRLTGTGDLEIREVGELAWVQSWLASSVQSGNLALFDDRISRCTMRPSFSAVEFSAEEAAKLFGVGVDGMRNLESAPECKHCPGEAEDLVSPRDWMKSLFNILKHTDDVIPPELVLELVTEDPKMSDSDVTRTAAAGVTAGFTSGFTAKDSGQANLPSHLNMATGATSSPMNQPKFGDSTQSKQQESPNKNNLTVIISWGKSFHGGKYYCPCELGHELQLKHADSKASKLFDPLSEREIRGGRNIVDCELQPSVKVEFIYGSDEIEGHGEKRFITTLETIFHNNHDHEPQHEVFGWYHDNLRVSFRCMGIDAAEQEVEDLAYEVVSASELRGNGGVHEEEASSSSKRSIGLTGSVAAGVTGVAKFKGGVTANQERGTSNRASQSFSNQAYFNCLKEANFAIHRESRTGELGFTARLFPPPVSYDLSSPEGRTTASGSMMTTVPIKVRGKWLVLEDGSDATDEPTFCDYKFLCQRDLFMSNTPVKQTEQPSPHLHIRRWGSISSDIGHHVVARSREQQKIKQKLDRDFKMNHSFTHMQRFRNPRPHRWVIKNPLSAPSLVQKIIC